MAEEARNVKVENTKGSKVNKKVKSIKLFFRDIKSELKKIIWPDKAQLLNHTLTVLVFTLVVGALIWISDGVFSRLAAWIYR